MFKLFQIMYPSSKVNYIKYKRIFNNNFNYRFKKPQTDKCRVCEKLKFEILHFQNFIKKAELEQKLRLHKETSSHFYKMMRQIIMKT